MHIKRQLNTTCSNADQKIARVILNTHLINVHQLFGRIQKLNQSSVDRKLYIKYQLNVARLNRACKLR